MLLAVDAGLATGLALYGQDGRLVWYRRQHVANRAALRRAVHGLLRDLPALTHVLAEGGGPLVEVWQHEAMRTGRVFEAVHASAWRTALLYGREQRTGADAKAHAQRLAEGVIAWSGAPRPRQPLRHDTAEAILLGLWGVHRLGWLPTLPEVVRRGAA